MRPSRRFLKTFSALLFLALMSALAPNAEYQIAYATPPEQRHNLAQLTHGPVVGAVTDTSARVFARTDTFGQVRIRYSPNPSLSSARVTDGYATSADRDFTIQVPLAGLAANTIYYLDIVVDGVPQLTLPYPHFKTFPTPGQSVPFKFVVLTDFGTNGSNQPPLAQPVPTFAKAAEENPDFVIIGGDFWHTNVDALLAKRLMWQNVYSLNSPAAPLDDFVLKILRQFPVAHVWDDHDYGADNADKIYPYKALSWQAFEEYFPAYEMRHYGDWQRFSYGNADFFMLDSRSERDPMHLADGKTKSMIDGDQLGPNGQWTWLRDGLVNSTATWKFIITPVVFNPTIGKEDSWRSYRREHDLIAGYVHAQRIRGVILISGDAHFGAMDNGINSGLPEMLVPGPDLKFCSTASSVGTWSEGYYGSKKRWGPPCNGYGVVSVDSLRTRLEVKNTQGKTKLDMIVPWFIQEP